MTFEEVLSQILLDYFENFELVERTDHHTWNYSDADGRKWTKTWNDIMKRPNREAKDL